MVFDKDVINHLIDVHAYVLTGKMIFHCIPCRTRDRTMKDVLETIQRFSRERETKTKHSSRIHTSMLIWVRCDRIACDASTLTQEWISSL